jgi:hypothetical protein
MDTIGARRRVWSEADAERAVDALLARDAYAHLIHPRDERGLYGSTETIGRGGKRTMIARVGPKEVVELLERFPMPASMAIALLIGRADGLREASERRRDRKNTKKPAPPKPTSGDGNAG